MSASAASFTFDHQRNFHLIMCHRGPDRARLAIGLALLCCLANSSCAFSQNQDSVPPKSTEASKPAAQKLPRVTTTVVVHGDREENYLPENIVVGSLDAVPLKSAPLSATVVTRAVLNDQVARLLSDVVKNDASVADDYVPVGYYGNYEIRGFPIDLATGIEIDGMTVAGEQDVPLENKESVEYPTGPGRRGERRSLGWRPY